MHADGHDPVRGEKLVKKEGESRETCWNEGLAWDGGKGSSAQGGGGLVLTKSMCSSFLVIAENRAALSNRNTM